MSIVSVYVERVDVVIVDVNVVCDDVVTVLNIDVVLVVEIENVVVV